MDCFLLIWCIFCCYLSGLSFELLCIGIFKVTGGCQLFSCLVHNFEDTINSTMLNLPLAFTVFFLLFLLKTCLSFKDL